jgi:hypothetical protein
MPGNIALSVMGWLEFRFFFIVFTYILLGIAKAGNIGSGL